MGAHFATRLVQAGASVAAGDVNVEGLAALSASCKGSRGSLHTRALDVADEAQVGSFVDWAFDQMKGLNGPGQQRRHPA
jgi:3-oxoacyl-[acyl-carrier protein] reductase